ncbi:hypothetical protein HYV11_03220 [Candidatus Dependentiae bacterium]|nr:hypothetical protein [Candidatus Dependentiae bacterium]
MKKRIIVIQILLGATRFLIADALSIAVPRQYLVEKASLVLYMLDGQGNQCVGTCRLDRVLEHQNISQRDLRIQQPDDFSTFSDFIELSDSINPRDNEVLLHIEFDVNIRVLRILLVKSNLLEKDSYDVLSVVTEEGNSFEDDEFSNLIKDVDEAEVVKSIQEPQISLLSKYVLYAKIYCIMQYESIKHYTKNVADWLCSNI